MPPPHPTPVSHFPHSKEKKASGVMSCHVGTPTQSLRRVVKPLGDHNRSRSHSPALDALSVKDKKTPRSKTTMLPGVDLTRRFAESVHGPCSLATNRGTADVRSPRGSPSLDRIHEGCPSSLSRDKKGLGTGAKTRLRGVDDTPPVKKAIAFATPRGKDSVSKDNNRKYEMFAKRKDLNERFCHEAKKDTFSSPAPSTQILSSKLLVGTGGNSHASKDLKFTHMIHLDGQSKSSMLRDSSMPAGSGSRGKGVGSDRVSVVEAVARRGGTHDKLAFKMCHLTPDTVVGIPFASDLPCQSSSRKTELSLIETESTWGKEVRSTNWSDRTTSGSAAMGSLKSAYSGRNECAVHLSKDNGYGGDAALPPLLCKSPKVLSKGFPADESCWNWELQEDTVAQEWFCSRESMSCFESFSGVIKTPEPQPSKSPELSKRAIGEGSRVGILPISSGEDRQVDSSQQQTPSPQATSSPEFLKRGSVPPSTGGCFGAGPLMGPEGMRSVKDRRKCKPRGILTIEGEFLCSSGSAELFNEEIQPKETISVPALASVEWMVAEGCDVGPTRHSLYTESRDITALERNTDLDVSPGSLSHLVGIGERACSVPRHSRSKSAGSEQMFWKKGLLYEWNLSLSDRKGSESPSPVAEEARESPVGKLRNFSPVATLPSRVSDLTGDSLVLGALGSVAGTPPSCTASEFFVDDEADSMDGVNRARDLRGQGLVPQEKTLNELSLTAHAPSLSLSFSLESSPDSCESWQDLYTPESTRWSNASSRGEWGDYLHSNRYKGSDSQFRFHPTEVHYPPAKADACTRSAFKESTPTDSYRGDSVLGTLSSTVSPYSNGCYAPDGDSWKRFSGSKCAIGAKTPDGIGCMSTVSFSRDPSPDILGISISISGAPSLDSSSDDFEVPKYKHDDEGVSMNLVHTMPGETEEGTSAHRGRFFLYEADYSPSSLLKADTFTGISASVSNLRGS